MGLRAETVSAKAAEIAEQQKPERLVLGLRKCVLRAAEELHAESMAGRSEFDMISKRRYLSEVVESWVIDRLKLRGETLADFVGRRKGTKKHRAKMAELAERDSAFNLSELIEFAKREGVRL